MKQMLLLVFGLVFAAATSFTACKPAQSPSSSSWTTFTNDAGGFSVSMPGTPTESVEDHPIPGGEPTKVHIFSVSPDGSLELAVSYNDLPKTFSPSARPGSSLWFEGLEVAVLQRLEGQLITSTDGEFFSHPMRDISFKTAKAINEVPPDPNRVVRVRIISVGQRMYQLLVISSGGVDASREVETFYQSFRLVK